MEFLDAPHGQQTAMNFSAIRERAVRFTRQDSFIGHWREVYWQPDLFVAQRFTVGVVVESSDGERAFQLMEKAGRIECFFSPLPVQRTFAGMMAMMRQYLAAPDGAIPPSPHFSLSEPSFIRGESAQALADRLFVENVPAAKPRSQGHLPA